MKILTHPVIKRLHLTGSILLMTLIFGCRRNTSMPAPNPLAGFYISALHDIHSNKAITDDYQDYIHKLSLKNGDFVGAVDYLEDRNGRHAVDIKIGVNGTWWEHVLIYDKDNKRVNVIKYYNGGYRS